jgi:GGDEF domain-containing protein
LDQLDQATKEEIQRLLKGQRPSANSRFSKLSLVLKISAGYLAMAVFTMAALVFSSYNLYAINKSAREIANVDLPVIRALIQLRGSLLAQESFAGKYAILRDPVFIDLFDQRRKESMANLAVLERTESTAEIDGLKRLYRDYQSLSEQLFTGKARNTAELRSAALKLRAALDAFYFKRQDLLHTVLKHADDQEKLTTRWAIGISCLGFLLTIWVAPFVTFRIFGALGKLQKATHRIAGGDFNYEPQIPAQEEISDLTSDFNQMAARLKELEQMNLDTLPLTRLPGNQAIERTLEERLQSGVPFAFCCANLDNFRPFGAHYGYARGSELLRVTGYLIHAAVNEHGAARDFAGHVGGDDFVMVVSTDKVAAVCEAVTRNFDAEVIRHFSPAERQAGGIERCDRYGVRRFFPITTISIAVINCGAGEYASPLEIARAAADVRDHLEKTPGSSWEIAELPVLP